MFSAWLAASDDPLGYVKRIDQRIEDITSLDMSTAEQLQVTFQHYLGVVLIEAILNIVRGNFTVKFNINCSSFQVKSHE